MLVTPRQMPWGFLFPQTQDTVNNQNSKVFFVKKLLMPYIVSRPKVCYNDFN